MSTLIVAECIISEEIYNLWKAKNEDVLNLISIEWQSLKRAAKEHEAYIVHDCGCCDNLYDFDPQYSSEDKYYSFGYYVVVEIEEEE